MHSQSITVRARDLTPAQLAEARQLRDWLMADRDLARDFDGAQAAAEALPTWLALRTIAAVTLLAEQLAARVAAQKRAAARQRAADKASYLLAGGLVLRQVGAVWLVPSATTTGTVYRVDGEHCTCQAGQTDKPCWHVEAARQLEAQATRATRIRTLINQARARQMAAA